MSNYYDPSIAEFEALMHKVHVECNAAHAATAASIAKCEKRVEKLEARLRGDTELICKAEVTLSEHKVPIVALHNLAAYEKRPHVELKLKVALFEQQRTIDEYNRLKMKHLDAIKSEIRRKKENKQFANAVETLTAQLEGKASPQEASLQKENEELKKQLATMQAQLKSKTDECETKIQVIEDLRDDFAANQSVTDYTWSRRHDACDELVAALEEQSDSIQGSLKALQSNVQTLEGTISILHHKCNTVAMERDSLQERFDESIKAHKMELEELDTPKCEGSSDCTSCVVHLERSLSTSRAAESQALQLVEQVNHDRMVS